MLRASTLEEFVNNAGAAINVSTANGLCVNAVESMRNLYRDFRVNHKELPSGFFVDAGRVPNGLLFQLRRLFFERMSIKAQAIVDEFRNLSRDEQFAVYESIARAIVPEDYGPLSDDDLTNIAAQTFSLLDEEESRASSR